jgi:hypothetical protein
MREAGDALSPVMERAEKMLVEGKVDEANDLIVATFPEATRTPVQSLVLGNVLYGQDPARSYKLHKEAAAGMPDAPEALFEWAMEQHRAKEYQAAAKSYEAYLKLRPDHAPAYGLLAECKIRSGDIDGAVKAWERSEKARGGSLEDFESLICEVNGKPASDRERAALLAKVAKGDLAACESLLLLDSDWRTDWWNSGPATQRLKHDLPIVRGVANPDGRVRAAICVAECALDSEAEEPKPRPILEKFGLLIDKDATLPENGKALSLLLHYAIEGEVLDRERARAALGGKTVELASKTKDAEAFNAAAYLYIGTPRLAEIDEAAWNATHDVRFAASLLAGRLADGKLGADDPVLTKALQDYPEDAYIAAFALSVAQSANKPIEEPLVRAIKAEYSHLSGSTVGVAAMRPRANTLRGYFVQLSKLRAEQAKAAPPPVDKR